jgi:glycosyltransferase involved in cell wall biosynthesis
MRILWVKAGKILPVDTGGKIRSFNLLRQLADANELTLLSYYGGACDAQYEQDLRETFPGAEPVCTGVPESGLRAALHYASRVPAAAPYAVTKFTAAPVRRLVRRWLAEGRFDVAVCDFLSASLNFPAASPTPCVLFQHNVESVLWRRQARHEPNWIKRLAFTMEAAKMDRYERAAVRRFPHVIAVSSRDRDAMTSMTDPARISVVPTGVDVSQYRAAAGQEAAEPIVMFLGSMDWEANVDAVQYFCRDIWPSVLAAVPRARFQIVGRNPHPRVRALASDSVEVVGTVPSVVEYLARAAVFAVPLRVGGGTRLKIFEAMAAGRAVVSTSVGAEGLDVVHDRDVRLADDAAAFARDVIELLQHGEARRRLERAASETAARYDWSAVGRQFETILRRVAGDSRVASPVRVAAARAGA